MSEHQHKNVVPADEGVYEMPRTAEDLKKEISQGALGMISGIVWVVITALVLIGIFKMGSANGLDLGIWHLMLISPDSTEKSFILSLIIFLPAVGVIFNMIVPKDGLFLIRLNTLVYTFVPLVLACVMLFGYKPALSDDGFRIYIDQTGSRFEMRGDGTYNPLPDENDKKAEYTVENGKYMVAVDGKPEVVRPKLVKNYFYDRKIASMQFEELRKWVNITDKPAADPGEREYTIAKFQYHLGVDGISFPLIILTTLLSTLAVICSFNITMRLKEYMSWFLILEIGMLGTFTALDYILFYVFWELVLVPMYFLIGIWGGPRKEYAALKFFLYTLFGSVFLLVGIIALYFFTGQQTFDVMELQKLAPIHLGNASSFRLQIILFAAFFLSFAIKVPIFPFHTWLPDAHVEAPTAISVILAGILLKMGTYGLLRMSIPTFPEAAYALAPALGVLAVINIVYGAMVAMAQTDMKKLVAYSSIGHMGFALLGMASMNKWGINAAQLVIINHGIISGSLFMLVGVIYDRAHTRDLDAFGGLLPQMRVYGIVCVIAFMANLGLPGLAGFWGEFWSLLGAISQTDFVTSGGLIFFRVLAGISVIGIIITAGYMLLMIRKVFMGPLNEKWNWLPDMDGRELVAVLPLIALMIFIGIYPSPLISLFDTTLIEFVNRTREVAGVIPIGFGY